MTSWESGYVEGNADRRRGVQLPRTSWWGASVVGTYSQQFTQGYEFGLTLKGSMEDAVNAICFKAGSSPRRTQR